MFRKKHQSISNIFGYHSHEIRLITTFENKLRPNPLIIVKHSYLFAFGFIVISCIISTILQRLFYLLSLKFCNQSGAIYWVLHTSCTQKPPIQSFECSFEAR